MVSVCEDDNTYKYSNNLLNTQINVMTAAIQVCNYVLSVTVILVPKILI